MAKSHPSSAERSLSASLAALTRWAHEDGVAGTQAARDAFLKHFEDQVDPTGSLDAADRAKRAQRLRTAHMKRLALRSAQSRRRGSDPSVPNTPATTTERRSEIDLSVDECIASATSDTRGPKGDLDD